MNAHFFDTGYAASVAALDAGADWPPKPKALRKREDVVADGESIHVPMYLMDSTQRGLALHDAARVASDARMIADARAKADRVAAFTDHYAAKHAERERIARLNDRGYNAMRDQLAAGSSWNGDPTH